MRRGPKRLPEENSRRLRHAKPLHTPETPPKCCLKIKTETVLKYLLDMKWDLDTADRAVLREPDFLGDIDKKVVVGVNAERECDRESEDSFELSH